jgi:predicted nucleotidyltransferase
MSTSTLSGLLFGKTRRAMLSLFFGHPTESFYLREVTRLTATSPGNAQRELAALTAAGILRRRQRGKQVYYQADRKCPVFPELQRLVLKTAGVGDALRAALDPLKERIRAAFVYGSMARGKPRSGSDVDLLVVGEVTFREVVAALLEAQKRLQREINPSVYSWKEFQEKTGAGHPFLSNVLREPRIVLLGDVDELAAMADQRLAPGARRHAAGNPRAARRR